MSARPLPRRVAGALICLWSALLSVEMPVAGCAHVPPTPMADPAAGRGLGLGLTAIVQGMQLRVWLRDRHRIQGEYRGIERSSPAVYALRYDAWRARTPAAGWPALGDSVRLATISGGTRAGVFDGFDWGMVRLRSGAEGEQVRFEELRAVSTSSGAAFSADTLTRLRDAGMLPLTGTLQLAVTSGQLSSTVREIPLEEVASLQVYDSQADAWVGAVFVGALLGVGLAIVIVSAAFSHLGEGGTNCSGPVPTLTLRTR